MVDLGPASRAALGNEEMLRVEAMCLCTMCPSYPEEDRGVKKAYCLRGDSDHKASVSREDCLCEGCEIYKHGRLYGTNYFCLTGAALARGLRNLGEGKPVTHLAEQRTRLSNVIFVSAGLDVHQRESPEPYAKAEVREYPAPGKVPDRTIEEQGEEQR